MNYRVIHGNEASKSVINTIKYDLDYIIFIKSNF